MTKISLFRETYMTMFALSASETSNKSNKPAFTLDRSRLHAADLKAWTTFFHVFMLINTPRNLSISPEEASIFQNQIGMSKI